MNKKGHPATLQARQLGNQNAKKHGAYAKKRDDLSPRAKEIVAELSKASHVDPLDWLLVEETARMAELVESLHADILAHGLTNRNGQPRGVVLICLRASQRLERLCTQFALTPQARATWASSLAQGSLGMALAEQRRQRADRDA
jgi:hypothetical protein